MGTNLIQLSCHTLRDQTHPTATATHAGTNHIRLEPPNSFPPIISNCHRQIHGNQSHPMIIVTHVGTKHIQLSSPYTWAPTKSNCYRLTLGPRTTPICHSHICGHKPHQPGNTKLVGTNNIQLPWPHTWASNTSNCHSHTRGHQPHPTGTTRFVSTNHIQLP